MRGRWLNPINKIISLKQTLNVAVVPIGDPGAVIGFFVIFAFLNFPQEYLLEIGMLSGKIMSQIIEKRLKLSLIEEENSALTGKYQTLEIIDEFIQEGVLIVSVDNRILRGNPSILKILGYSREEILDQPVDNILIGDESIHSLIDQVKKKNILQ